jgi:hypothetical protein
MQIALTVIVISCIAGALYLHRKRKYTPTSFHELIFWVAVIVTLFLLLVTLFE